jgi:hypothetical protein
MSSHPPWLKTHSSLLLSRRRFPFSCGQRIQRKLSSKGFHPLVVLVEKQMLEVIERGKPTTGYMRFGDRVRIEMFDKRGRSIFGAIDQVVEPYRKGNAARKQKAELWNSG